VTAPEPAATRPSAAPPRFSLRARLLAAVAVVALLALLVADFATYAALRSFLVDRIDSSLSSGSGPLARLVIDQISGEPVPGGDPRDQAARAAAAPGAYVEVRAPRDQVIFSGSTRGDYATATPQLPTGKVLEQGERVRYFTVDAKGRGPDFRVRAESMRGGGTLLVALPLDEAKRTLHQLFLIELFVTGAALVAALIAGGWLVRVGLKPLRDIEATASNIAGGDLSLRVPQDDRTEVGRLGTSLNIMLRHIEDAFARRAQSEEQLRQFVADASHELRTPVSAVSAYAELFERGANQRPGDLERVMRGIRVETARMTTLIDDLLLLARLDEGRPLRRDRIELLPVVEDSVDTALAVGPEWPVTLEPGEPVTVVGDSMALRQVIDNLLANVRTHTPMGTPATVSTRVENAGARREVVIEVADSGPGLPAEHAERVFERFYRVDTSRSRARGGTGLGLAVVAALVAVHDGRVEVAETPGGGATFRVRLPLAPPDSPESPEPVDAIQPTTTAPPVPAATAGAGARDDDPDAIGATRSSDR
jgi:two-component system OmpR family sensor kinase